MTAGPLTHSSTPFCRHEVWGRWSPERRIARLRTVMGRLGRATGRTVVRPERTLSVAFYRYFVIALNCLRAALPLGPVVFDARSRQSWI